MSTYDYRLAALEKEGAVTVQDIAYKLDDINNTVTNIKRLIESQGWDIKYLTNRLQGIDIRLEGLTQEVRALQEPQNIHGQDLRDIKRRLDGGDQRFIGIDRRLDGIDQRFGGIDQRLNRFDQRFNSIDQRFTSLEEKFDQRFAQVLQAIANLTN